MYCIHYDTDPCWLSGNRSFVLTSERENTSNLFRYDLKPLTQIARIEVAVGEMEVIHEDRRYMGHVNTSPALPDILNYRHEGPWNWIDSPTQPMSASAWGRMWGLNILPHEA